jgi:hypothetical protein
LTAYSFEYLLKHSEILEVIGFSGSLKVRARVANREMLIALKANSMRLADQRDIIALCNQNVDIAVVLKHLKRCPRRIILRHIENILKTLDDEQYKNSIRGVFILSEKRVPEA